MNARLLCTIALAASLGVLSACGDDDEVVDEVMPGGGTGGVAPMSTTVNVTLDEYEVGLAPNTAPAGSILFSIYNQGTETHEFVVVQTDLAPDELPTNADGSFDEEGAGVEVLDEIEAIGPGTLEELEISLEAGSYVLLCNIVVPEGDELESHFHEGMHAPLLVE